MTGGADTPRRFLGLAGIRGQIAALVCASIIATHLLITAIFFFQRPNEPDVNGERGQPHLAALVQLLAAAPADERPQLIAQIKRGFPHLELKSLDHRSVPAASERDQTEPHGPGGLARQLGPGFRSFALGGGDAAGEIGIVLPDGSALSAVHSRSRPPRGPWGGPWIPTLLFAVVCLTLFGLWAARALSAPLLSFAAAAENFSLEGSSAPLPERGPQEIRALARALNRMRGRITALIDDRTKMLAAISHDLRTPITRLRLRSEFIEDDTNRSHMLRDLDQMRSMLEAVLSFLRNGRKLEQMTLVDLASTLQLVTDQFADIGHKVAYDGPGHAMAMARPDDLHRAVTNLVENAVRFGAEATIRLRSSPQQILIEVEDDGPGISDARKLEVLEPFVRGDDARNMNETSGFGLGLSIARAIAQAHGGVLTLNDRAPHGLIVRISLPPLARAQHAA
jgi:signal transduction histidine kinase